ncbi:uncharacterized protein LOC132196432 isoform X2 [Neocloeon triangulifer]|uniref:uncharacterized protein LOC132196432 isoform X2 n=1 Tax=Neocloeon triangulifer TaxID=2078957 RepID=UPI00286F5374|nr:uncharacterized protein LOC132196432 isoform X2 [Neocloeon triangulifer]
MSRMEQRRRLIKVATATNGLEPTNPDAVRCNEIPGKPGTIEGPSVIPPEGWDFSCSTSNGQPHTGLGVNITLDKLNLNADLGDYLLINPGTEIDKSSSALLTWKIKKPIQFSMPVRDNFTIKLVLGARLEEENVGDVTFRLRYSNFDLPTPAPTTVPTTTGLPTPPADEEVPTYTVFVGGIDPEKFYSEIETFKERVASASNEICRISDIKLIKPIEAENVLIYYLRQCPPGWPNSAQCIEMEMAVPAFVSGQNPPYQLDRIRLEQMWNLVRKDDYLPAPMYVYDEPLKLALIWWVCVFFGVMVIFIALIILTWRIKIYRATARNFEQRNEKPDMWPKADLSVSSPQVQVPPYLVIEQPKDDAESRRFYYEERNSFANPEPAEGMINEAYEFDDDDDDALDIVAPRTTYYIYDNPDQLEYDANQRELILDKHDEGKNSETTL